MVMVAMRMKTTMTTTFRGGAARHEREVSVGIAMGVVPFLLAASRFDLIPKNVRRDNVTTTSANHGGVYGMVVCDMCGVQHGGVKGMVCATLLGSVPVALGGSRCETVGANTARNKINVGTSDTNQAVTHVKSKMLVHNKFVDVVYAMHNVTQRIQSGGLRVGSEIVVVTMHAWFGVQGDGKTDVMMVLKGVGCVVKVLRLFVVFVGGSSGGGRSLLCGRVFRRMGVSFVVFVCGVNR